MKLEELIDVFDREERFNYLKKCLDLYSNSEKKYDEWKIGYHPWENKDINLFEAILVQKTTSYSHICLFFAQTQYLLEVEEFNKEKFQDWMRVIRNIVDTVNRTTNNVNYQSAISLIDELSNGADDIYNFLSKEPEIESKFASKQVKHEVLKAKLIVKDIDNKQVIFDTENTYFCQGDISFALYCIDFEKIEDNFDREKLRKIKKVFEDNFNSNQVSNELRRAFFTIDIGEGIGEFFHYFLKGGTPKISASYDEWVLAHKYLLIPSTHGDRYSLRKYSEDQDYRYRGREYCKKMVDNLIDTNLDEYLKNFDLEEFKGNDLWKRAIVENSKWLDHCKEHYIAVQWFDSSIYCHFIEKTNASERDGQKTWLTWPEDRARLARLGVY